jgi:hypothetical protein
VSLIPLYIQAGGSGTVVTSSAASTVTLNVHQNGRHNAATDTVTAGSAKTYTVPPVWIAAPSGVAHLTITGPGYGS